MEKNIIQQKVLLLVLTCCLIISGCRDIKDNPTGELYTTIDETYSVHLPNTTDEMLVTIEGGYNPRLKSVSSSADWLKVEDVGPTEMEEFTDPETGFKWLSGGSYPLLRLTYDSFDDLTSDNDDREAIVKLVTMSDNTLTLKIRQSNYYEEDEAFYIQMETEQGDLIVINNGGGEGGPRLSDFQSVNTDFEKDWTQEEAIWLYSGKGPETVKGVGGYSIVPLPWADTNESRLPEGEAKAMLDNADQWKLVLNFTGNRAMPDYNYFAMYNPRLGKLRFFYYLSGDANLKDINDHLWAVSMPTELALCMEHAYGIPENFQDHQKLTNTSIKGRYLYLTTPYTDNERFSSMGNIVPEAGWWAFDIDMSEYHNNGGTGHLANLDMQVRLVGFHKDQVSLQSAMKSKINGSFNGTMNLDALWKKPRIVNSTGSILSAIAGVGGDLLGNKNAGDFILSKLVASASAVSPWALGMGVASVGLKALSAHIKGFDKEEKPDVSKTGQINGSINLGMDGTIETDGFIKGDRQTGLKHPNFTLNKMNLQTGVGRGVWNLEQSPIIWYVEDFRVIEPNLHTDRYVYARMIDNISHGDRITDFWGQEKYPYNYDNGVSISKSQGSVLYYFDPRSVMLCYNEELFDIRDIKDVRVTLMPGIEKKPYGQSFEHRKLVNLPTELNMPVESSERWVGTDRPTFFFYTHKIQRMMLAPGGNVYPNDPVMTPGNDEQSKYGQNIMHEFSAKDYKTQRELRYSIEEEPYPSSLFFYGRGYDGKFIYQPWWQPLRGRAFLYDSHSANLGHVHRYWYPPYDTPEFVVYILLEIELKDGNCYKYVRSYQCDLKPVKTLEEFTDKVRNSCSVSGSVLNSFWMKNTDHEMNNAYAIRKRQLDLINSLIDIKQRNPNNLDEYVDVSPVK